MNFNVNATVGIFCCIRHNYGLNKIYPPSAPAKHKRRSVKGYDSARRKVHFARIRMVLHAEWSVLREFVWCCTQNGSFCENSYGAARRKVRFARIRMVLHAERSILREFVWCCMQNGSFCQLRIGQIDRMSVSEIYLPPFPLSSDEFRRFRYPQDDGAQTQTEG